MRRSSRSLQQIGRHFDLQYCEIFFGVTKNVTSDKWNFLFFLCPRCIILALFCQHIFLIHSFDLGICVGHKVSEKRF